jgi:dihydrofolate synthase / folylpolyglutamate synthase
MAGSVMTGTDWVKSLSRFGVRPGLERTRRVLHAFGNPHHELSFLHVAGTNGKGSVCAYLTALLSETFKVGTFTSPAFDGFRGRFLVSGRTIDDAEFNNLADRVREVCLRVTPDDPLTEFEVLTVMAILYFHQEAVDAVVWETGLGGRYDSTNVVLPLVTAITNVSYDHVDILGPTLLDIARDKAGIIKPGVPIITAAEGAAYTVIEHRAKEVGAPLYRRGSHFAATRLMVQPHVQHIAYRGVTRDVSAVPIPLFGRHQVENAAVALAMYEIACQRREWTMLGDRDLRRAMQKTFWPGRLEVFDSDGRPVILDGAHNPDGARRLVESLQEYQCLVDGVEEPQTTWDWTFVIGILDDKDTAAMLDVTLPLARRVITTAPRTPRALDAHVLAERIQSKHTHLDVQVVPSVHEAIQAAMRTSGPIACWGSLYTVDEARKVITNGLK